MTNSLVIKGAGLTKTFIPKKQDPIVALDHIDIEVQEGKLTALIGPDGAGKTTLMRLICGLLDKTEGELEVLDLEITSHNQEVQEQLSYMPGKFGLYEDLTVQENMNLYADLHGIPAEVRPERFSHLLEMTGMSAFTDRLAGKLSGGMKQKLGLACTLVRSPKLLLLDEPTVGVDPLSRRELWEILKQLVKEDDLSVFVSTAYMDEAALCEDVYVINKGRFLAHGSPEEICAIAKGRSFTVQVPEEMSMRMVQSALLNQPEITDAVPANGLIRFNIEEGVTQVPLLKKLELKPKAVEPRLEDSFMILLHRDEYKNSEDSSLVSVVSKKNQQPQSMVDKQLQSKADKQVIVEGDNQIPIQGNQSKSIDIESLRWNHEDQPVEIEVQNLVKKFGDFTAVANTSFQVHQGEVFGLLGPNGAGKTTTFRMLCGLLPATSGVLSVAGVNLRNARTQARANIGYVSQKFSLYGILSVYENLRFYAGAYGLNRKDSEKRIQEVVKEFNLGEKLYQPAETLPGGYKQRLSMAAALMHEPKILFLDEPTSGIDPLARRAFWQHITELAAKGTTIIITTHFMDEAEYCDRFMIQDHGKLLILGSPNKIRHDMNLPSADMNEIFIEIVERARQEGGRINE